MHQPTLTIFYQFNPWSPTIGGIQTCIRYILKYAPKDIHIRLVGTGNGDPKMPVGQWHEAELFGRNFSFMPLIELKNDNFRGLVPTTVKYTMALLGHDFSSDFLQFHRIEASLGSSGWSGKRIFYIHNDIDQEMRGTNQGGGILWRHIPWAYFALERRLVRQFDRIFSCNTKAANQYKERYPQIADNVSYLVNTVDSDVFYSVSPEEKEEGRIKLAQELGLSNDTRFILFAGRLHPQKQPLLLVRSFAELNEPNTHLLIVGQGELEEEVRAEITRLGLSDRVTIFGPLAQTKLANFYRVSSMFVLTSAYEGLCRGSIEALACGTPVVTTRAGETPNFLSADSGIVVEEQTPEAIASAWKQVLINPSNYPSEACVRVVKPYDARYVVNGIYTELLENWRDGQGELLKAYA